MSDAGSYSFLFRRPWLSDRLYWVYLALLGFNLWIFGVGFFNLFLFGFGLYLFPMLPILIIRRLFSPPPRKVQVEFVTPVPENLAPYIANSVSTSASQESFGQAGIQGVAGPIRKVPDLSSLLVLPDGDEHEVFGESKYQMNFSQLVGKDQEGERVVIATLSAEPNNQFDADAISVQIDGLYVGYIPTEETYRWHPEISKATEQGKQLACHARLWWRNRGDAHSPDIFASVTLYGLLPDDQ